MRKKNYRLAAAVFIAFFGTVALRAVYEVRETREAALKPPPVGERLVKGHYAATPEKIAALPDKPAELLLEAGVFDEKGFTPSAISPQKIKGNPSVRPSFRIARHGLKGDDLVNDILRTGQRWEDQGNTVTDIVLDLRDIDPSPEELRGLTEDLRNKLSRNYWLGAMIDATWVESLPNAQISLGNASKGIRTYYYDMTGLSDGGIAFVKRADDMKMTFFVMIDSTDQMEDTIDNFGKYGYLAGILTK